MRSRTPARSAVPNRGQCRGGRCAGQRHQNQAQSETRPLRRWPLQEPGAGRSAGRPPPARSPPARRGVVRRRQPRAPRASGDGIPAPRRWRRAQPQPRSSGPASRAALRRRGAGRSPPPPAPAPPAIRQRKYRSCDGDPDRQAKARRASGHRCRASGRGARELQQRQGGRVLQRPARSTGPRVSGPAARPERPPVRPTSPAPAANRAMVAASGRARCGRRRGGGDPSRYSAAITADHRCAPRPERSSRWR